MSTASAPSDLHTAFQRDPKAFSRRLITWQREHGRHDLPWQNTHDPYRIWLSEVMLQQTQVNTVIPYYARFLARCPDVAALAAAPNDDVMALWAGLGYYSRARNLHRCAQEVMARFEGRFPERLDDLITLPGIGRSTAAAIAAFAFGAFETILDGNVKRVVARVFGIPGYPGEKRVETAMWLLAENLLPAHDDVASNAAKSDMRAYTQGLMDLGATLCTRAKPDCGRCPFAADCVANLTHRQAELPTRKPSKTTPTRQTVMLILEAGPYVLLYRRPPTGIWGGLWSLPEAEDETSARHLAAEFGGRPENISRLAPLTHVFTHFRLEIQPLQVDCGEPQGGSKKGDLVRSPESPVEWVHRRDLGRYGLPAPVQRLLSEMTGSLI